MRIILTAVFIASVPTWILAATKLDRIEVASEAFVWNLAEYLKAELPEIDALVPDIAWDDDWRASAACILDNMAHEKGNLWVGRYIREAEAFAATPIESAQDVRSAPEMLRDPFVAELAVSCGLLALAMERAAESGLLAALTSTDLSEKIGALP